MVRNRREAVNEGESTPDVWGGGPESQERPVGSQPPRQPFTGLLHGLPSLYVPVNPGEKGLSSVFPATLVFLLASLALQTKWAGQIAQLSTESC